MLDETKIMQYADGTLPEDEKEAVEKAIENNPELNWKFISDSVMGGVSEGKIAAQLFTIRDHVTNRTGFADSLAKLSDIGYKYVQFAAVGAVDGDDADTSPAEARKILDDNGLKAFSAHRLWGLLKDQTSSEISKIISSFEGLVNLNVFQTTPPKLIFSAVVEKGEQINVGDWNINQSMGEDKLWTFTDSVLKTVDSNIPNKECFILSDFPVEPMRNFIDDFTDWRFYLFGRGYPNNNIGIKSVKALNQIKLPNDLIDISTRVDNIGSVLRSDVPIELYLDGDRAGQFVTKFQPGKNKDFLFQVYPGKSGVIKGRLEIPKDDFILDNFQTFELNIPEKIFCKVIASSQEKLLLSLIHI